MSLAERKVYGQRIKQGRILRGLSQEQLGKKVGVTRQAISNCEKDNINLSTTNLLKLSETLDLPLSFFYRIPEEDNSDNIIFFRSKDIPKKTKEQLREEINIFDKEIVKYFEKFVKLPSINLPDLSDILEGKSYNYRKETIMDICKRIREHWGIGNKPIDNLAYLLQVNGFIISRQYINQDKTDAFSQNIDDKKYIFISGNKECAVRSRFDLAHELGHLVLHNNIDKDDFEEKIIEKDADSFASELLYPSEIFLEDIQDYSLGFERFIELKEKWKVSIQLLVRKCKDLKVISDEKYIYFQKRISFNRWRKNEPLDNRIVSEKPRLFEDVIELLIEKEILTKKDLLVNINLDKKDIIKYCNLDENFFDDTFCDIIKIY
ncbi:ImmA/IrrE family metallo-endopeptidase [Clostridium botulinum]|uniref:XRE family transcriptional regulator n=1 Tax=Clostridium botulinum TaxID=1491 RepID=UPI0007735458|nr:XRE family transcriptional regulator [Clostridium botulinum]MBN1067157.1 ImmA/IrrE family metallo-endopeptidase [Clostridium botulinum]MBN1074758.1 ImmA/IrrE family metallo-endopeptidase [Clostridium botulinum]NFN09365.1 ImmA/IrrE family metallo-endopeptidase [Clostridium botulinum]NFN32955.1 ImmA/IrrE family metallo-endopeptidase [Clostridium botulinum]